MRAAEAAAMAYCGSVDRVAPLGKLNLRLGAFEIMASGQDAAGQLLYFALFNQNTRSLYFSFRGTQVTKWSDITADLTNVPVPVDLKVLPLKNVTADFVKNAQVHSGFWKRFTTYQANVTRTLQQCQATLRQRGIVQYSIQVVGHSLGAAWAYLQAADWASRGFPITAAYTFAMPLVGNRAAVDGISNSALPNIHLRLTNRNDIVPHVGFGPNGAQPAASLEFWVPDTPDYATRGVQACGMASNCSLSVSCLRWSFEHHSQFIDFSIGSDICLNQQPVPNTVYV
jgi:hypothetical protein